MPQTKRPYVTAQRWQNPTWYAALSLRERVAALTTPTPGASSTSTENEQAARRLKAWKAQKPFDQGTFFADRLANAAITEDDLLALLAEPLVAVQTRYLQTADVPEWLAALREAFEDDIAVETDIPYEEMLAKQALALYLKPISPLIKRGLARLRAGIQQLHRRYASLPFDPQRCIENLFTLLPERLLAQVSKTFVLEMHVARLQGRLQGATPGERFEDFVCQLTQEGNVLALLEEYPVLARQCIVTIDDWVDYAQEFLGHLCADWSDIRATFSPERDPGLLVDVQGSMGDPHRKGRSVLVLTFHSGLRLLYKPRSLAIDAHFQELLAWLNEQDAQPAFRSIGIIDRGGYGWSEYVRAQSCSFREEVERFYERQGSYLALLYALNATDIHVENVIASGEYPILVDLEALFHPRVGGNDPTQPYNPAMLAIDQSVFRVGLLPHRIWTNQEGSGVDLSGFGGQAGQMTPYPLPQWEEAGTDQMRLIRRPAQIPVKQNRPRLNGEEVDVLDYREQIIAGFTRIYRFLQEQTQREASYLLSTMLPRFAHDEVRLLLRPSQRYASLLIESFHPDLLRDALARDRFFDRLWHEVELRPYLARVIAAECRDLLRGDIPIFTTYPDRCTIFTSDGEALHDFFDEPGLHLVEQRLRSLDEQDLARQRWIIEATLATLLIGSEGMGRKVLAVSATPSAVTRERLIADACAVGDRLDKLAARSEYGASWLGVNVINGSAWSLLPTDIDLYGGTSGIALFLGYLGAITAEERYTELSRLALASVQQQIEQQKKYLKWANIGVFDGLGSAIYLLVHLSVLWQDPALLRSAEAIVELLPALIAKDERLDIIGGCAGCILNLLSFYRIHPSAKILEVARLCGDRLLATAQEMPQGAAWTTVKQERPLGGFAHGTAGIALSLAKLAEISGDEHYQQMAEAALAYDHSLFLPEQQNWADLRTMAPQQTSTRRNEQDGEADSAARRSSMVAWCHGAAGIGLSRMAMLASLDSMTVRKEIEIALRAISDAGVTDNHSLCHGALGNADILLTATQLFNESYHREALERMKAMIVDSIAASGWVTGVPLAVETPGLMSGLAGIGYELLRLAEPEKVPSVLLISPPG